jgi:hypothetical protein
VRLLDNSRDGDSIMTRLARPPNAKGHRILLRRRAELLGTYHFVEERQMGWLFKSGCSRRDLVAERTKDWERTTPEGVSVKTTCLAHCYRGGAFSGVLWTVWGRSFTKDGVEVQNTERWIGCDLLRSQKGFGWGYKDLDESMGPYFYSCPLKYLDLVPIDEVRR